MKEQVSQEAKSTTLKGQDFVLPKSLKHKMVFTDVSSVEEIIRNEQDAANISKPLFYKQLYPNRTNFTAVRFVCRYCSAFFNIRKREQNKFVVTRLAVTHTHSTVRFEDPEEEEMYKLYEAMVTDNPYQKQCNIKNELIKAFGVSSTKCAKLIMRFQTFQTGGFVDLEDWVNKNQFQMRLDWGKEPREEYPRLMVLASAGMQQNYSRYGDAISFDVVHGILRNATKANRRYRAGIITVLDTNLRPLLGGIAFISEQSAGSLYQMFKMLFHIHERTPQSIMTADQQSIAEAIDKLRDSRLFEGAHLINPCCLLKAAKEDIVGDRKTKSMRLAEITEVIHERNQDQYDVKIVKLKENPQTQNVMQMLLERKQKIFYCNVQAAYIGIRESNAEPIESLIKSQIPSQTNFEQFLKEILVLDGKLKFKSDNGLSLVEQPIEKVFCDDRLLDVRRNYERKLVQRFLQNYVKGIRECEAVSKSTEQPEFEVRFLQSSRKYYVKDWCCQCNQFEKTGVPCPHLLLAASSTPGISYSGLISLRWKRQIPEVKAQHPSNQQEQALPASLRGSSFEKKTNSDAS